MKTVTISKSLKEIWLWKDKCYEESKGLRFKNYLNKIHNNVQETLKDSGFIKKIRQLEVNVADSIY